MSSRKLPKGRGAVSNPAGRFERYQTVDLDDGWEASDPDPEPIQTTVTPEQTRRLIARNDSPDVPFDQSINPYKGCEHGCVYCFARPTHAFLGLSPGLDFESRIFSKPQAPERLRQELSRPGYRRQVLALGANTDPYQPVEGELKLTRRILQVLSEYDHPVSVVTKSNRVLRDLDILAPMAARKLASVLISVTSLDRGLARRMEPRAPTPERRLQTLSALSEAGVPVGVLASPMIPGLNDAEMESILERAAAVGASSAGYILIRLPLEIKSLFTEWLETHYPRRASHVLNLIRETRGGSLYDERFGVRMRGTGPYAELLQQRFTVTCGRLGLDTRHRPFDLSRFRVPPRRGSQRTLFD
ncbi:MAG: PA0069 family radical SAM protein [Acidobacteriota bacterium]